ncbi:MAG: phospholipid carrier-dependent glycosyltransferase [Bacilli bacterium]
MYNKLKKILDSENEHLKKADYIILAIFIVLYSILSFYQLGSFSNPETYMKFTADNNETVFALKESTTISKIRIFTGNEFGDYEVYLSNDGSDFELFGSMKLDSVFAWSDFNIDKEFTYLKLVGTTTNSSLGDIQFYNNNLEKVPSIPLSEGSKLMLDEIDTVPNQISYMNSTYFDEIYFARTAYEYANGLEAYEWVHPPLGKVIQMLPIKVLGMNPFSYRLMGNIAGIIMIPVIYILALNMFKNRKYAILGGSLMALDTFHFAQTRMGTVDSFLVLFLMLSFLFMYQYISLNRTEPLAKRLLKLFLSGLTIGCAIATKWTGLFGGLALAIIFFADLISKNFGKGKKWGLDTTKIIIGCIVFFVIVPLIIYIGIYYLFPLVPGIEVNNLTKLIEQTTNVYNYHSLLSETHPFTSPWYQWPLMIKPVWYYVTYIGDSLKATISGIGNPAIWWMGILGVFYLVYDLFKKHTKESGFLIITILCMFLPYIFIGRVMFMYHYFPVLPFVMLAVVALFKFLTELYKTNKLMISYLIIVLVLFILFLPIVSGMMMPVEYIDALRWFSTWIF